MTYRANLLSLLLLSVFCLFSVPAVTEEATEPKVWGIAIGMRSAAIPYQTEEDTVSDVIPLMFYDDDGRFFLRALTAGFRLYNEEDWQFSAIGRYRFTDIPADFQNQYSRNALDLGLQLKHHFSPDWHSV